MSNLNMNKAAAAILVAGLIGMVTGKVTEFLYFGGPEHPGAHAEIKRGYSIEVTEAPKPATEVTTAPVGDAVGYGAADATDAAPQADAKSAAPAEMAGALEREAAAPMDAGRAWAPPI